MSLGTQKSAWHSSSDDQTKTLRHVFAPGDPVRYSNFTDAAKLPLLRQFPGHNDRAHDAVRVAGPGSPEPERKPPELSKPGAPERAKYLTLNDLESYLWKFRKNRLAQPGGGGGSASDWSSPRKDSADPGKAPPKPQKSSLGVGGPKRSAKKKNKKKGSDSDSD